jgi:uncharacterized RDD family membrane protein YckC
METIDTPLITKPVVYAGFWLRVVAYIIDGIILGAAHAIIFVPLFTMMGITAFNRHIDFENMTDEQSAGMIMAMLSVFGATIIAVAIMGWLYYALMESSSKQATIGKMALGLKVTDLNGNRIDFMRATGRYFGKFISQLILCIGYMMAGFTQKKQALHDILANCLVVKT